jgi:hypothetical protein
VFGAAINESIAQPEVELVVRRVKTGTAMGIENNPNQVFKSEQSIDVLHKLFNLCLQSGLVPSMWKKALIKLIPKNASNEPCNPRLHRGISLISCVGKLYSGVINQRLVVYMEMSGLPVDEQNGFRTSRSCLDHIFALTSVIRNRKAQGISTYCCYIDMAKVFDTVDRHCLLYKLQYQGIKGKLYDAIKAMYHKPECAVKVNDKTSGWFVNDIGVRQGDPLSPTLFSLYINDLAVELKNMNLGVKFGNEVINILLYADDMVILAENEVALQAMMDKCAEWCMQWRLSMNIEKTKVVHYRKASVPRTQFKFESYGKEVEVMNEYK